MSRATCEVDIEAMNVFSKVIRAAALKFSEGFNMHERKDCSINKNKVDSSCPRCREFEYWDHVVRCRCADEKRNEYSEN